MPDNARLTCNVPADGQVRGLILLKGSTVKQSTVGRDGIPSHGGSGVHDRCGLACAF